MADLALVFAGGRRAPGRRVSIVTQSGGAGALSTDAAVDLGLRIDPWVDETRTEVGSFLPFFASTANPIDLTGALINDPSILDRSLQIACDTDETDVVLVVLGNSDKAGKALVDICVKHHAATSKPFVMVWTGGSGQPRLDLLEAGVPTFAEPLRAVRAIAHLVNAGEVPR
nr:hypothetical protein [Aeromicrobium senzhongii]